MTDVPLYSLHGKRVWVAGHRGLVGSALVRRLEREDCEVLAVPRGAPKKQMALDYIAYATGSTPLAAMAGWVPYGPARRSALPLVGINPDLKIAMAPHLPTAHFATAFAVDDGWWLEHGGAVAARWQGFVDGTH